jgi:hypothetical protein
MVEINHNKNIQRIIDRISDDSNLFDSGKTTGLLRAVSFGDPSDNLPQAQNQIPYAYVTTASDMQETSPEIGVSIPDNVKSVTVEYQISIIAQSRARTTTSQKQLYDLVKNMRAMTESDPTFTDPASPGTDPVFVRSIISSVNWDEQTRGQLITIITMTLIATIGALFFLEIPGIGDPIPLISKPIDRDTDSIEDILDDTLIRKDTAPITSIRSIFAEFETSSAILSTLRSIKLSRASDSYTITSPTGAEVITAYLTEIESSTGFSTMETTVIQLEVVTP